MSLLLALLNMLIPTGAILAGETTQIAQAKPSARATAGLSADIASLEAAAKVEGVLTLYHGGNAGQKIVDAFQVKYEIKVSLLQLGSTLLQQRYASEADAGSVAADLVITSSTAVAFADNGIRKGWMEPVTSANIPVLRYGLFPAKFVTGATAIVQVAPWAITYNVDKVKGTAIPKDWTDLLSSQWKGQLLFSDPRTADAILDVFAVILDAHGESFFRDLRSQNLRVYPSIVIAIQALVPGKATSSSQPSDLPYRLPRTRERPWPMSFHREPVAWNSISC